MIFNIIFLLIIAGLSFALFKVTTKRREGYQAPPKKIERPCWYELMNHLSSWRPADSEKWPVEGASKFSKDKTLLSIKLRTERYAGMEAMNDIKIFFRFGGSRNSPDNHIQLTPFELDNGAACSMITIGDIHSLPEEVKTAKWMAPWASLTVTVAALSTQTIALIGTTGYTRGNAFPRLPIATLRTQREAEWTRLNKTFEFVTIAGATAMHLPSTTANVVSLAAATTGSEFEFITGTGVGGMMTFMQALCLWMSIHNGFNDTRFYARAFGVTAANGHPVYFSKPAGLHNATIWHALGQQYTHWCTSAKAANDYSCLTVVARVLVAWGYTNMFNVMKVNDLAKTAKIDAAPIVFTAPCESYWAGTMDNDVLEGLKNDRKLVVNAIVAQQKVNATSGKRAAVPEIPETSFSVYRKAGHFGKGVGKSTIPGQ